MCCVVGACDKEDGRIAPEAPVEQERPSVKEELPTSTAECPTVKEEHPTVKEEHPTVKEGHSTNKEAMKNGKERPKLEPSGSPASSGAMHVPFLEHVRLASMFAGGSLHTPPPPRPSNLLARSVLYARACILTYICLRCEAKGVAQHSEGHRSRCGDGLKGEFDEGTC